MKIYGMSLIWAGSILLVSTFKAQVNALRLCKLRKDFLIGNGHGAMVFTKHLHFFIFQLPKAEQGPLGTCQLRSGRVSEVWQVHLQL